jgi:hypothetical protein
MLSPPPCPSPIKGGKKPGLYIRYNWDETLIRVLSPPTIAFQVGLKLFLLLQVFFFPEGRAVFEAGLAFPQGRGIG